MIRLEAYLDRFKTSYGVRRVGSPYRLFSIRPNGAGVSITFDSACWRGLDPWLCESLDSAMFVLTFIFNASDEQFAALEERA